MLSLELKDNAGLQAMLYLDQASGAGSVFGGRALEGTEASVLDPIPASLVRDGQLDSQVNVIDEGGNIAKARESLKFNP